MENINIHLRGFKANHSALPLPRPLPPSSLPPLPSLPLARDTLFLSLLIHSPLTTPRPHPPPPPLLRYLTLLSRSHSLIIPLSNDR